MIQYARGPFRLEKLKLKEWREVGAFDTEVSFEREILWTKESESKIEYRHGGRLLKEGATYNDFYGFMTSKEEAIKDAKRIADAYIINKDSSLQLTVTTKVYDVAYIRTRRCEKSNLLDDSIRHEVESASNQGWRREDGTLLEDAELSSEIVWNSLEDLP